MRELSKNDWRVLAEVLEFARGILPDLPNKDLPLRDTQESRFLCRNVLDHYGFNAVEVEVTSHFLWTRGDLLIDFFASIARENAEP